MRIAIFHNLPPGGAKRVLYEEIKALTLKHDLDLFEFDCNYDDFLDPKPLVNNVHLVDFSLQRKNPSIKGRLERDYANFISLQRVHKKLARKIDEGGYDACLIHIDIWTESPFILKYLKTPNIYYSQELLRIVYENELKVEEKLNLFKRLYEKSTRKLRKKDDRANARSAQQILTNSRFMQRKIIPKEVKMVATGNRGKK